MARVVVCRGKRPDGSPCMNGTSHPSRRCPEHQSFGSRFRPSRPAPARQTRRWRRLSKEVIAEHVRRFGWVCPGWRVPTHPSTDLTTDHSVPLVAGGAPFDRANLVVMCRGCNSRKSLRDRQLRR